MGSLYAVQFCKEVGLFDVFFEGDVNTIVKEINSAPPFFLSKISQFIKNIYNELQSFRLAKFSFTPRECNMAVHTLANEATRNEVEQIWLEDFPLSILSIVTRKQHCP
jgi:hypothetical protein